MTTTDQLTQEQALAIDALLRGIIKESPLCSNSDINRPKRAKGNMRNAHVVILGIAGALVLPTLAIGLQLYRDHNQPTLPPILNNPRPIAQSTDTGPKPTNGGPLGASLVGFRKYGWHTEQLTRTLYRLYEHNRSSEVIVKVDDSERIIGYQDRTGWHGDGGEDAEQPDIEAGLRAQQAARDISGRR